MKLNILQYQNFLDLKKNVINNDIKNLLISLFTKNNCLCLSISFLIGRISLMNENMSFGIVIYATYFSTNNKINSQISIYIYKFLIISAIILGMITNGEIEEIYLTI